ncbi:MAG: DUF3237 domain-containing protein [Lachnospiraceae bacterium]|nr:DUF3237 domain-containing protein [Lachnospiraceae bacterium]MCD8123447.1 DUF3237 domain-containing protein [Lachnospiraceae bacterium]
MAKWEHERPKLLLDNPEGLKYEYIMTFLGYAPSTPEEQEQCYQIFGDTPNGFQMVGRSPGGFIEGPKIRGIVHEGADWMTIRNTDGVVSVNCRNTLKTDDGEMILMEYQGYIHGPNDFVNRWLYKGEMLDPSEYYFRTAVFFTAKVDGNYNWLNKLVCIGVGKTDSRGGYYDIYAIK